MARDIVNPSRPPKLTRSTKQIVRAAEQLSEGLTDYEEARSAPRCQCGHLEGDHQSSRAPAPHPIKRGLCFLCSCEMFRLVEP